MAVRYVAEIVVREYSYAGDRDVERIVAAASAQATHAPGDGTEEVELVDLALKRAEVKVRAAVRS